MSRLPSSTATFTLNSASTGGGIFNRGDPLDIDIRNTILAWNTADTGPDVQGEVVSNGSNIIQDGADSSGFGVPELGVNPLLDPTLKDNGGFTQTHALLAGSPAINPVGLSGAPAVDQRGASRDSTPDIGAYEFGASIVNSALWITTRDDVSSPSGAPGLDSWKAGEVLSFHDPNLTFDPVGVPADTTNGMFSSVFNLDALVQDSDARLGDMHYVQSSITIGSGGNSFTLNAGDILFSTMESETLQSNNTLSVTEKDVTVFRPDIPGDYSSGTFTLLLDGAQIPEISIGLHGVSLVESNTLVGDSTIPAGTFLLADASHADVFHYTADTVGAGATSGTWTRLIEGADINIGQYPRGIDLVETTTEIGGTTLPAGSILLTLNGNDSTTGDNSISTNMEDIFYLTVTKSEWDQSTTQADATLFFDGSDVGLDTSEERVHGFTLIPAIANQAPTDISPNTININENTDTTGGMSVGTLTASDPDSGETFSYSIQLGGDGAFFSIGGGGNDELLLDDGVLDFETKASYNVTIRVTDSASNTYDETLTVNVTNVNEAPTLTLLTSPVDTTTEDTEVEVSFADLTAAGNENDVDGTVDAFIVKTISSGTLKIGADAGSATAWAAGTTTPSTPATMPTGHPLWMPTARKTPLKWWPKMTAAWNQLPMSRPKSRSRGHRSDGHRR